MSEQESKDFIDINLELGRLMLNVIKKNFTDSPELLLQKSSEWISVTDRLPKKDDKYIICLINDKPILCEVHDAMFSFVNNRISFYWPSQKWVKDEYFGDVTHWMPLPKPPGDENEYK